jgi:hypothetical protein
MDTKHLIAVERVTLILAAIAIAAGMLFLGPHRGIGVSLGAVLMVLNAWVLRRIGVRAFKTWKRPGTAILLFNLKMGILLALVWAIIRYFHVDPIAFVIGISVFPVAIVVVAVKHALRTEETSENG